MKKNHLWVMAAALICSIVTFSACTSDDTDNPVEPEPVFLSSINYKIFKPGTDQVLTEITENLTWEDELLKHTQTNMVITIGTIVKSSIMDEYFTYDGKGRCIEN